MSLLRLNKIKSMESKEIRGKINEFKKELITIRGKISSKTNPESPGKISQMRRTIARMKTILRLRGEK